MIEVLGFLGYTFALALPSLAIALLIVAITKIHAYFMYPIWILLTGLMLWSLDIHLLLSRFF